MGDDDDFDKLFDAALNGHQPTEVLDQKPDDLTPMLENPKVAPYAQGTCSLDINQISTGGSETISEYSLEVWMYDANKKFIGGSNGPQKVNFSSGLHVKSKLEDELVAAPNKDHNGMVYFTLGTQKWNTVDNSPGMCSKSVDSDVAGGQKKKKYYCTYVCNWGGKRSSDSG